MEYLKKNKQTIITASGQDFMDAVIAQFEEFEVVANVDYREDLYEACKTLSPDIVVVSDNIGGKISLNKTLIKIKVAFPNIRIVYFYGKVDLSDTIGLNSLNMLIASGIYDIITESAIEVELIRFVLNNPRTIENVDYLEAKNMESIYGKRKSNVTITQSDNDLVVDSSIYQNLSTFMSTKGGSGKTFLLSNIAVAIANSGINTLKGVKPRIGIIDLDLASFGITNVFGTENKEKNIIRASIEAQKIIKEDGTLNDNKSLKKQVIDDIKKMFVPSSKYSNIFVLGGPERNFYENDSSEFRSSDIVFIIEAVIDDFDILLVDMNSDCEFTKVYPLFSMSKDIYSVLEMNFKAFKAQTRQEEHLNDYLSSKKIKYIFNKKIVSEEITVGVKDIEKSLDYSFLAKVPYVSPEEIFIADFNRDFIVNRNKKALLETRYEIFKIANDIWPIRNFDKLAQKMESMFNNTGEIVEEEKQLTGKENKLSEFLKNAIGLEEEEEDLIKEGLKNNKNMQTFKDIGDKMKKAVKGAVDGLSSNKNKTSVVGEVILDTDISDEEIQETEQQEIVQIEENNEGDDN